MMVVLGIKWEIIFYAQNYLSWSIYWKKYFYWTSQSNKHCLYASLVSDRPIVCQGKLSNTTGTCLQIFIQFRKWPGKCQMYVTFSCMNKILQVQINSNMVWNKFFPPSTKVQINSNMIWNKFSSQYKGMSDRPIVLITGACLTLSQSLELQLECKGCRQ